MSLDNLSYCRYLTRTSNSWTTEQWQVWNIVQAIKGKECRGYADLIVGGVTKRLTSQDKDVAIDWFVERVIEETRLRGRYILCPIPDSQCTPTSTHITRTLMLATRLSAQAPQLIVWPHLKFTEPIPRKIRNEQYLLDHMVCTETVPKQYIILLDDVCTTGAHARAAQRRLVAGGTRDMCAMSVARTMLTPDEPVFGIRIDRL
jgi:hypothetical protein